MSDSSHAQPLSSSTPIETPLDETSEPRRMPPPLALVLGIFKLAAAALVVYLTYEVTSMFAQPTPPPAPLSDDQLALAKKAEDVRAQGKKTLSSYGWVDPVMKGKVRIPIDRAMELLLAESARPPTPLAAASGPAAVPTAPAVSPGTSAAAASRTPETGPGAVAAALSPPPAPAGMRPEQIYAMVCLACHDADGRGKIVKLAMPTIPDLTDPKWQATRTDADLTHSILEGKESVVNGVKIPLMLPMKDKLALAKTDVKDMVAFMRSFSGGKQVITTTSAATTGVPAELVQALAPAPPAAPTLSTPAAPAPVPAAANSGTASPPPTSVGSLVSNSAASQPSLASAAGTAATTSATPSTRTQPSPAPAVTNVASLPPALTVAPGNTNMAAQSEKLRGAGGTYNTLCIACHGLDGRGSLVRLAMPAIPDFTSRDWHGSRSSSQLTSSILEGKGTLMPPWNARLTPEQARGLVLYVRSFGGTDILAKESEGGAESSGLAFAEFESKIRSLRQQFDEVEKQLQALASASGP
jgi:mono/diheme cytochrome c family protein